MAKTRTQKQVSQGLEASLWEAANKLRSNVDAAEYKHVVLGLIFLKYVSDVFEKRKRELESKVQDPKSDYYMPNEAARKTILDSRDEYASEGVFWVPEGSRWADLMKAAKQTDIGARIDSAMDEIEKENPSLRGVLPKNYSRRELTPATLGGLIDVFSREDLTSAEHENMDVLGRVFEYMVGAFARAEGKLGGEFYTPRTVVQLLVDLLEPFNGRVYDPACGSGGMFVQADRFVQAHGGSRNDIAVYGQEQNPTTWRLAKMNLALRGIDANLGPQWGDSFGNDLHPDLRADYILANPPFNISDWGAERLQEDQRWKYGTPPESNANYAWIQHMLHHLTSNGTMATVLSNGSLSSTNSGEGEIRKKLIDEDLVECVISLPPQLFYTVQIPVCIWILTKNKSAAQGKSKLKHRSRTGEILFIDARNFGEMASRTVREFTKDEIGKIASTYHSWRSAEPESPYRNIDGFCFVADIKKLEKEKFILSPGRYVGVAEIEKDNEPSDEKLLRIQSELEERLSTLKEQGDKVSSVLNALRGSK
jgi:type I restriction enzyme M protein